MGMMQSLRSLFISEPDVKALRKVREEEEERGLFTHKISKTITYYYQDHHHQSTPLPPNTARADHSDGSAGRRRSYPPPPPSGPPSSSPRPLVLLLPWLGARPVALSKYRDLYLGRGMDVLQVESSVWVFLWPSWGLRYALEVLRVLEEDPRLTGRPVLVHAVSIGGYTFTMMLCHVASPLRRQRGGDDDTPGGEHAGFARRVTGHIYDSLVAGSLDHMATGLGRTLCPRLEGVVRGAAMLFFWLFKRHTADMYEDSLRVFRHSPVRSPALFFFCDNDPMCDPLALEATMAVWRGRGVAVESQS